MVNSRKIQVISLPTDALDKVINQWDFESGDLFGESLADADYVLFNHRDDEGELCEICRWEQTRNNGMTRQKISFSRKRDLSVFNLQSLKNNITNAKLDAEGINRVERLLSGGSARPIKLNESGGAIHAQSSSMTMDMAKDALAVYYNVSPAQVRISISSDSR